MNRAENKSCGEWVHVASAVAGINYIGHLEAICRVAGSKLCGGVVIDGNFVLIRGTLPLENLDADEIDSNEIDSSVSIVVSIADELERMSAGRDQF